LVIGPGLAFEAVREHFRPTPERSAFREGAAIALASLVFLFAGILLLAVARALAPNWVANPRLWVISGRAYVANHLRLVSASLIGLATASIGLAGLVAFLWFRKTSGGRIDPNTTAWFQVFREKVPGGSRPMVRVQLHDGTEYLGLVIHYSANILPAERELTLGPPLQYKTRKGEAFEPLPNNDEWKRVVIPALSIDSLWVRYPPARRPS
jgi:hypothetical protein